MTEDVKQPDRFMYLKKKKALFPLCRPKCQWLIHFLEPSVPVDDTVDYSDDRIIGFPTSAPCLCWLKSVWATDYIRLWDRSDGGSVNCLCQFMITAFSNWKRRFKSPWAFLIWNISQMHVHVSYNVSFITQAMDKVPSPTIVFFFKGSVFLMAVSTN